MNNNTLFNQIPGYPCMYSLKAYLGEMTYEYRSSENSVIVITVRDHGSWAQRNIAFKRGNKIVIEQNRRLWGDSQRLMSLEDFLAATNLTGPQLGCLLEMEEDFIATKI